MDTLSNEEVQFVHKIRSNPYFRMVIENIIKHYEEELGQGAGKKKAKE